MPCPGPGGSGCCGGCTCSTTICVESCSGTAIAGATVTIGSLAPATTGSGGCVSICLDALGGAGSYTVTVSASGFTTYSNTKALTCGGTTTIKLFAATINSICITVTGCCTNLSDATVVIGGVSYLTNSSGQICVGITDAGTFAWSVSKVRFVTQTGSVTISACASTVKNITVHLLAASGFVCPLVPGSGSPACCTIVNDPIPTTLTLTDSAAGACLMIYNAITKVWTGSLTYSMPAYCGNGAFAAVMTYSFPASALGGTCGVAVGSTSPAGLGGVECAFGNENYSALHQPDPCGCDYNPINPGSGFQPRCCTNNGCVPTSLAVSDLPPFDLVQTMKECTCVYVFASNVWQCSDDGVTTSTGCCYGIGTAPVITITE